MPNRIIREDILTSEAVDKLDFGAEVFYRRLLSKVDDYGRYYANSKILLSNLYQLRADVIKCSQVEHWLAQTVQAKLVMLYRNDDKLYLQVAKTRWQIRSASKFPEPPRAQMITNDINCKQMNTLNVVVDVVEDVIKSCACASSANKCLQMLSNGEELQAAAPQAPDKPAKKPKKVFPVRPESKEECAAFVTEKLQLPQSDGLWLWDHWMAAGFRINGRPMASWKHAASNWKAQRYFPSLKEQKR